MKKIDDNTWWIGSTDFIKPKRKFNWYLLFVWLSILAIAVVWVAIWCYAIKRF